jgi:bacterial/archaeal transporter family protein
VDWFWYALLAALCFSAYSLLVRRFLRDGGDAQAFALVADAATALLLFALTPFDRLFVRLGVRGVLLVLLASVLLAAASALFTWGRQLEEVSRTEVVRQTMLVWAVLGGVLLLGERLTLPKALGAALVLAGSATAFWRREHLALSRGLLLVLGGAVLAGGSSLLNRVVVQDRLAPTLYGGVTFLLGALWLALALPGGAGRAAAELRRQRWRVAAVAVPSALSIFLVMRAFQAGEASLVTPVYNASLLFSVLAGVALLGERDQLRQKLLGVAVAAAGILLLRLR